MFPFNSKNNYFGGESPIFRHTQLGKSMKITSFSHESHEMPITVTTSFNSTLAGGAISTNPP